MYTKLPGDLCRPHAFPHQRHNLDASLDPSQPPHRIVMPPSAGPTVGLLIGHELVFVSVPRHLLFTYASRLSTNVVGNRIGNPVFLLPKYVTSTLGHQTAICHATL